MTERVSLDTLKEWLRYTPETGTFVWLRSPNGTVHVGDLAGALENSGYIRIAVKGRRYQAHTLAWFYMTGEWLPMIDHRDLDRANNRWNNLRPATGSQNAHNRARLSTNKSGLKGVVWHDRLRKWQASISKDGRQYHLGYFDCKAAAHLSYSVAASSMYGEYQRAA